MFKKSVESDLSYIPGRLADAESKFESVFRRLVKDFIRRRHTPRKSDLRPLGEFIGHTLSGIISARLGDVEGAERSAEEIRRFSPDPHFKLRSLMNEALFIASYIPIVYLLDFHEATKASDLTYLLPGWKKKVPPIPARARVIDTAPARIEEPENE